jgi:hypothetical protein
MIIFTHFSKCAWHSSSRNYKSTYRCMKEVKTRRNPVRLRTSYHLKGSLEVKKSVVIIKKNKEIDGREKEKETDIVAWFSHIFARRCGKPIFTHLFLVHPGIIILIKKMLNIFSFMKRNKNIIIIII